MAYTLSHIVARLGGALEGADRMVERLAPLDVAGPADITFLSNPKYRKQLDSCAAGAVIVSPKLAAELDPARSWIVVDDPYLYFAKVATLFHPPAQPQPGLHATAVVGEGSVIKRPVALY